MWAHRKRCFCREFADIIIPGWNNFSILIRLLAWEKNVESKLGQRLRKKFTFHHVLNCPKMDSNAVFMNERDLCVIAIVCGARSRNGNKIYVANNKLMTFFPFIVIFFFFEWDSLARNTKVQQITLFRLVNILWTGIIHI